MRFPWFQPADDFLTDRLVHFYSSVIFLFVAILLSVQVSNSYDVYCSTPEHFTQTQNEFVRTSCWDRGLFYTDNGQAINDPRTEAQEHDFNVIKTLPLVLFLQVLVFLTPRLIWRMTGLFYGCDVRALIQAANDLCANRQADFSAIAGKVLSYLQSPCHTTPKCGAKYRGYNLVVLYLLCKLAYVITCVIQMAILTAFLGFNFFTFRFGTKAWEHFTYAETYTHGNGFVHENIVDPFPRLVLCDAYIRVDSKIDSYTLQCELAVNCLVEGCLLFLWVWLWFIFFLLILSSFLWLFRVMYYHSATPRYKSTRVQALLGGYQNINFKDGSQKSRDNFTQLVTQPDGLFILALLEANVSVNAASGLLRNMWMVRLADDVEKDMNAHVPLLSDEEAKTRPSETSPPRMRPTSSSS